jgi:hypothetical protein
LRVRPFRDRELHTKRFNARNNAVDDIVESAFDDRRFKRKGDKFTAATLAVNGNRSIEEGRERSGVFKHAVHLEKKLSFSEERRKTLRPLHGRFGGFFFTGFSAAPQRRGENPPAAFFSFALFRP